MSGRPSIPAMVALAAAGWLLGSAGEARAEPRFAVREGLRCSHCHVNRTGGGMRNPFGASFAQTNLSTYRLPGFYDQRAGSSVFFGSNLRIANRTVLPAETSLNGVIRESGSSNTFEMGEANLYVRADGIQDRLTIYLDETVAPEGASSREAFVLLHGLPMDAYVKAGRFMLPFGLRIWDDRAFIRQETGFNYANADLGVEGGVSWGPVQMSVAVTNGSQGGADPNKYKQVSSHAVVISDRARAGASFAWNDTSEPDFDFQSFTSGLHAAGRLGRLMVLGELDWIRGKGEAQTFDQWAVYAETNFEAIKGLYARFAFEAFDPLVDLDNNERDRFIFGASWFPMQLLELRAEYRLSRDIPQRVEANADELIIEIHGFL